MTTVEKEKFLEENGWVRYGSRDWVKKEWLEEPEKLNRDAHLCPNWYHTESLDDAVTITKVELAVAKTLKECALEHAKTLERLLLNAARDSEWSDIRSAVKAFARKRLVEWYLVECADSGMKPNPFALEQYNQNQKVSNIKT